MAKDKAAKKEKKDKKAKKAEAEATEAPAAVTPAAEPEKKKKDKKDKNKKRGKEAAETPAETPAAAAAPQEEPPAKRAKTDESEAPAQQERRFDDDDRKVFLGNLPFSADEETVKSNFEGIESVRLLMRDGQFRGSAFITFDTPERAQEVAAKGSIDIGGRTCKVNMAGSKPPPREGGFGGAGGAGGGGDRFSNDARTVFIGRCPDSINDEAVKAAFNGVESVRWITDRETGQFKGVGFIVFTDEASAQAAAAPGQVEICGQSCRVSMAGDKPAGGGRGGDRGRGDRGGRRGGRGGRGGRFGGPKENLEDQAKGTKVTFDD